MESAFRPGGRWRRPEATPARIRACREEYECEPLGPREGKYEDYRRLVSKDMRPPKVLGDSRAREGQQARNRQAATRATYGHGNHRSHGTQGTHSPSGGLQAHSGGRPEARPAARLRARPTPRGGGTAPRILSITCPLAQIWRVWFAHPPSSPHSAYLRPWSYLWRGSLLRGFLAARCCGAGS